MRRIAGIFIACVAAATLLVVAPGAEEGEDYKVRAIFDNASFVAPGMDVRIAGANVGSVAELDVTFPGEPARLDGSEEPGKAVVVLQINDAGFQDFRQDASCHIFSQSLLGEKFVECQPTQPRAAGTAAPPELEVIGDGERGEGQYLLPLEQNGKSVDLDLVNNIMSEPYPDRFRLILNDLGAALATRGDELEEIIERSNPALRETNQVLASLARQNKALESLSKDSDAIMTELAAEKERVSSFINESTTVGEATLAERAALEETFARFPGFLRELRSTMTELRGFSDAATPVFGDLRVGAPALTRASEALGPFSDAATKSFKSLGDAAEEAGPLLADSDPVVRQTRDLAQASKAPTKELALLLSTMRETGGFQGLFETIYGLTGTINAFDSFGHFTRALIPTNVCFDYTSIEQSNCGAKFTDQAAGAAARAQDLAIREPIDTDRDSRPQTRDEKTGGGSPDAGSADDGDGAGDEDETLEGGGAGDAAEPDPTASRKAMKDLLDFMIGEGQGGRR